MTLPYDYAWEKFSVAINGMAVSALSLQNRLVGAFVSALVRLRDEDLPPDLSREFHQIREIMTRIDGPQGSLQATADNMSDEEAQQLAHRIFAIYEKLLIDQRT